MPTDIFLFIGQSNAIGRASYDNLGAHPAGTLQYSNVAATQDTVIGATVPLEHEDRDVGDMGPDLSFAQDYSAYNTGDTLLFLPNAFGATGLGDATARWAVSNADLYTQTVTRTNALIASDPSYVLRGIVLQIGERDTTQNTPAATFETLLDQLISELRANITGASNVRVSIGPMLPAFVAAQPNGPAIDAVLADTPNRLNNVRYISPTGLTLTPEDSVHFDAPSLRTLGSEHFSNFQDLLTPIASHGDPWFDLTVGNLVVGGPHTDFAVLVTEQWLTASQRTELFTMARSDGANIRFSSDNTGNTEYPFELIAWDAVGETFAARVKPPFIAIGTQFAMRIVDGVTALPAPDDPNGRVAVWPDYDGVYHGNSLINSASATGVGDLTAVNSALLDQSPVASIGRFRTSPGGNFFQASGFFPVSGPGDKTVFATLDVEAGTDQGVLHWAQNNGAGSRFSFVTDGTNVPRIGFNGGSISGATALGGGIVSTALVHDASESPNAIFFNDGMPDATATVTIDIDTAGTGLRIGRDNGTDNFDGFLSDIRFRNVAVSADWLATEHANRANIDTFGSSSDMQTGGGAPSIDISPVDEIVAIALEIAPALSIAAFKTLLPDNATVGVTGAPQLGGPSAPAQRTYLPQRSTRTLLPRP